MPWHVLWPMQLWHIVLALSQSDQMGWLTAESALAMERVRLCTRACVRACLRMLGTHASASALARVRV